MLPVGELTEQGYHKKLALLDNEYGHCSKSQASAREISAEMEQPTSAVIKERIQHIFGRKRSSLSLPKNVPKQKRPKPIPHAHRKKITVLCVNEEVYSVPNRKLRDTFVKQGMVKEIYVSKNERISDTMDRM